MKVALINPHWDYEGSIYFGCREPHLPLELGYARQRLLQDGHQVLMLDGQLDQLSNLELADRVAGWQADMTVVTTAPTYLFWRCAQPELRVPAEFLNALEGRGGRTVAVGPHGSVTPRATLRKLDCDIVVRGECEEVVSQLAGEHDPAAIPALAFAEGGTFRITGGPAVARFTDAAALDWPQAWIDRHRHHHHRYGTEPVGPGAEVEASRGCPYNCSFCAKIDFRDKYRRRDLDALLVEIDGLIAQGVRYLYFVDEIFLPQKELLQALVGRPVEFGVQTRIDLWKPEMLRLLGEAGCVSIEAGVESLTVEGREALAKRCKLDTDALADLLIEARRHVPFVQANLIGMEEDDPALVELWRKRLIENGVWANEPVPLYPYPSSPSYRALWGEPDDKAWERAHEHYLSAFSAFSDIQEQQPLPLERLEARCCSHH